MLHKYLFTLAFSLLMAPAFSQTTELWGTNFRGGSDKLGRIVKVDASGSTVTEAHSFPATYAGGNPDYTKFIEYNGYLYATNPLDGKYDGGLIYRYNPATNTLENLYSFSNNDGLSPYGGMLLYNGELYGTTNYGGVNGNGTIWSFNPATNVFTKRAEFTNAVGSFCSNGLALHNNKMYATTGGGGANGWGTLFEFDPATNVVTPKINMANNSTVGRGCHTGLTFFNNKLYGAMRFGGSYGLIFEYDPATNTYTKKIDLAESTGRDFTGRFTAAAGVLYAAPNQGPGQFGQGCIVAFDPVANTLVTKISFDYSTGSGSFSDLTFYNGKYYGSNTAGGTNFRGSIYEWDPVANVITRRQHGGTNIGETPTGTPGVFNDKLYTTFLYGVFGSANNYLRGSLTEWDLTANTFSKKFDYSFNQGSGITTKLTYAGYKVYGITPQGGNFNRGVLFSKDVNTGTYTVLRHFAANAVSSYGNTSPVAYNNKIYGTAPNSSFGTIYEYDIATGTYTDRFSLTNATGYGMSGRFYLHSNNKFYGVSRQGGTNGFGTIYSWDPATNVFTVHVNLTGNYSVYGGFAAFGSKLYVPGPSGGNSNGDGVVLEFDPSTNILTIPYQFNSGSGSNPNGEFTEINGRLYTACAYGGSNFAGSIISYLPGSGLVSSHPFTFGTGGNGSAPVGMLHAYNNELYGFTTQGGVNNNGTTYKFNPFTNTFTKLEDNYGNFTFAQAGNGFISIQKNVLAVQFTGFSAVKTAGNSQSLLQWDTRAQSGTKGYAVERSADGSSFTRIGWVEVTPGSSNRYSFTDIAPLKGINYYRVAEEAHSGNRTHSAVRTLDFSNAKLAEIYPNPFADVLQVKLPAGTPGVLIINEASGKKVVESKLDMQVNRIELKHLAPGTYSYVLMFAGGRKETGKLVKN